MLNVLPSGIYTSEMDNESRYLIIGGFSNRSSKKTGVASNGVSVWRVLNSEPWLKAVTTVDSFNTVIFNLIKILSRI